MSTTLVDIKNHLFSHFLTDPVFRIKTDVASIKLDKKQLGKELVGQEEDLFRAALEDFKRVNIVSELGATGSGVYILTQPLNTFNQTVTITPMTAEMIADLINGPGRVLTGNKRYTANKLGLTDSDLQMVVSMCHMLLDEGFDGGKELSPSEEEGDN